MDSAYCGVVKIILTNTDKYNSFIINPGDKIAQLIIIPIFTGDLIELDDIEQTERGAKGFGSSGNK